MNPASVSTPERRDAHALFDCPSCRAKAGRPCVTERGYPYSWIDYVHLDRLVALYRDVYLNAASREDEAFEFGWKAGVEDAKASPVTRGARVFQNLEEAIEAGKETSGKAEQS